MILNDGNIDYKIDGDTISYESMDNKVKIQLKEDCVPINVSYLTNHFMRILDMLDVNDIKLNFYEFNGFTICIVNIANYQHMMFPMN